MKQTQTLRPDKTGKALLTVLRHLGRLHEVRQPFMPGPMAPPNAGASHVLSLKCCSVASGIPMCLFCMSGGLFVLERSHVMG